MTIAAATLLFLLVMDPLGNIPFFLAALSPVAPKRRSRVIARELLLAYGVMLLFLFVGKPMLGLLNISEPALTIAGGVILFLIAIRMVFPSPDRPMKEELEGEPFLVPLAIPYVAGPSLLAAEILVMSREPDRWMEWTTALTAAWMISALIIALGSRLSAILGRRGLIAVERLTGMILVAVAVQMFLTGVDQHQQRNRNAQSDGAVTLLS